MNFFIAVLPLFLGFALDCLIGDPYNMPHPIRAMGKIISVLENYTRKKFHNLRLGGIFLAVMTVAVSVIIPTLILILCYRVNLLLGSVAEGIMCFFLIAPKCLKDESMKVYKALKQGDTERARRAVSMIVGRDTDVLDRSGIIRAAVETVAENTSDGVTSPLFYMSFGGAVGGFIYKAVNTLDSMVGYRDEKYADIGRFSAKLDDFVNYIPSRLTAIVMIFSSLILGLDYKNSYRIWRRDRRNHASPNSAQTEAVCAGALGVRLAGDAYYFGKLHKKPYIGDNLREIEAVDIKTANRLMYLTSFIFLLISAIFRGILFGGVFS